jgi:hypothetical protein
MASFVSATLGISVSIVLLAIAWARETPWDRALYHAALTGGMTAMLGRYWIRQMVRAARATQKKREEEEAKKQEADAGAGSGSGPAVLSARVSPVRTA